MSIYLEIVVITVKFSLGDNLEYPAMWGAPEWLGSNESYEEIHKRVYDAANTGCGMIIRNNYVVKLLRRYVRYLSNNPNANDLILLKKIDVYLNNEPLSKKVDDVASIIFYLSNTSISQLIRIKITSEEVEKADLFVKSIENDIDVIRKTVSEISSLENPSIVQSYILDELTFLMEEYNRTAWNYGLDKSREFEYRKTQELLFMSSHNFNIKNCL